MSFAFNAALAGAMALSASIVYATATPEKHHSDWGGATPLDQAGWVSNQDYPSAALEAGEHGDVVVSFTIGTDGRISDCQVVESSGYKRLDEVPCKILSKNAKFRPALDKTGKPVATRGTTWMTFSSSSLFR